MVTFVEFYAFSRKLSSISGRVNALTALPVPDSSASDTKSDDSSPAASSSVFIPSIEGNFPLPSRPSVFDPNYSSKSDDAS